MLRIKLPRTADLADHLTPRLDAVVISSAVKFSDPEVARARALQIPVIARAEMLGELLRMVRLGVAVAGTHGKTTTTSLVGLILEEAGLDPTVAVGGNLRARDTNVRLGGGEYMVAEADESDVLPAPAPDHRGRDQYRSGASRSLRHDRDSREQEQEGGVALVRFGHHGRAPAAQARWLVSRARRLPPTATVGSSPASSRMSPSLVVVLPWVPAELGHAQARHARRLTEHLGACDDLESAMRGGTRVEELEISRLRRSPRRQGAA